MTDSSERVQSGHKTIAELGRKPVYHSPVMHGSYRGALENVDCLALNFSQHLINVEDLLMIKCIESTELT